MVKDTRPSGTAETTVEDEHRALRWDAREEVYQLIERDRGRREVGGVSVMRDQITVIGPVARIRDETKSSSADEVMSTWSCSRIAALEAP
jgi:hypothetical protein